MKEADFIVDYIKTCYNKCIMDDERIDGHDNIKRYSVPIMSGYVENAIALYINKLIEEKGYYYIINAQLSVGEGYPLHPDILIFNDKNEIKCIVEVKAQLGNQGDFNAKLFKKNIKRIEKASKNGTLFVRSKNDYNEKVYFTLNEYYKSVVVILMGARNDKNISKFEKLDHYVLFNDITTETGKEMVTFENISSDFINHTDGSGMESFIMYVKDI